MKRRCVLPSWFFTRTIIRVFLLAASLQNKKVSNIRDKQSFIKTQLKSQAAYSSISTKNKHTEKFTEVYMAWLVITAITPLNKNSCAGSGHRYIHTSPAFCQA